MAILYKDTITQYICWKSHSLIKIIEIIMVDHLKLFVFY